LVCFLANFVAFLEEHQSGIRAADFEESQLQDRQLAIAARAGHGMDEILDFLGHFFQLIDADFLEHFLEFP
jgi:chloramphenicol 3-O-phosphotransferase